MQPTTTEGLERVGLVIWLVLCLVLCLFLCSVLRLVLCLDLFGSPTYQECAPMEPTTTEGPKTAGLACCSRPSTPPAKEPSPEPETTHGSWVQEDAVARSRSVVWRERSPVGGCRRKPSESECSVAVVSASRPSASEHGLAWAARLRGGVGLRR